MSESIKFGRYFVAMGHHLWMENKRHLEPHQHDEVLFENDEEVCAEPDQGAEQLVDIDA